MISFIGSLTPTNWFFIFMLMGGFIYNVKANKWNLDRLLAEFQDFKKELKSVRSEVNEHNVRIARLEEYRIHHERTDAASERYNRHSERSTGT